jgi:threonine aldolase
VEANEVFLRMDPTLAASLHEAGFEFHRRPGSEPVYRLVVSHATDPADIARFVEALRRLTQPRG